MSAMVRRPVICDILSFWYAEFPLSIAYFTARNKIRLRIPPIYPHPTSRVSGSGRMKRRLPGQISGGRRPACHRVDSGGSRVSPIRFFSTSTDSTQAFTTSPTLSTSDGCRMNRLVRREMWASPS